MTEATTAEATTADLQAAIDKQNRIIQSLVQQRNKALDDVVVMQAELGVLQELLAPDNGKPSGDTVKDPDTEGAE
jgi:hypothetical protein|tara:strand:- start:3215 stop:3439 length:225 start_codon:yes stop_codon:yes gene_type:complete